MKKNTTTMVGIGVLTAAVVGLGASVPSLADSLSGSGSTDTATSTTAPGQSGQQQGQQGSGQQGQGQAGMMGDHDGDGPHGHHGPGAMMATAAKTLGLTEQELMTQLQSGKTLGQIADSKGVDRQKLVDAILAQEKTEITSMLDQKMTMGGPGMMGDRDGDGMGPGQHGQQMQQGQQQTQQGQTNGTGGSSSTRPWQPQGSTTDSGASSTSDA